MNLPLKHEKNLRRFPATVETFFGPDGNPLSVGDLLMQNDLAETLDAIRNGGRDVFYRGKVAEALVKAVQAGGGIITASDLEA